MRPETRWPLTPLPWQSEAWQRLESSLASGKLAHAILLAGPPDIGKRHLQQALAARLLCRDSRGGTACGQCRSCELMEAGSHPDCLVVEAEEDSRVIKIDQIRRLIDFAAKTPALGSDKAILLGPAEAMNTNAANALLKCLEEPSASTSLILYAHQPSLLAATVRSRCQSMPLAVPERSGVLDWLQQTTGDANLAGQLLVLAEGHPLAARQIFLEDRLEQELALQAGLDALLEGRLSALELPRILADLELSKALLVLQNRLEKSMRPALLAGRGQTQQRAFLLRDELARLRRSVAAGANPNRQLALEDLAARMQQATGH